MVNMRDYLRFLWWENENVECQPVEYRMKVHLFGAVSSPACCNKVQVYIDIFEFKYILM